jgi:hypothetical protein
MGIYWPVSVASFEVLSLSIHDSLLFCLLEMSNPPLSPSLSRIAFRGSLAELPKPFETSCACLLLSLLNSCSPHV